MRTEAQDIVYEFFVRTVPSSGAAWIAEWWANFSWSAFLPILFIFLQIMYLLRKWWREETEWGLAMKQLIGVKPNNESDP